MNCIFNQYVNSILYISSSRVSHKQCIQILYMMSICICMYLSINICMHVSILALCIAVRHLVDVIDSLSLSFNFMQILFCLFFFFVSNTKRQKNYIFAVVETRLACDTHFPSNSGIDNNNRWLFLYLVPSKCAWKGYDGSYNKYKLILYILLIVIFHLYYNKSLSSKVYRVSHCCSLQIRLFWRVSWFIFAIVANDASTWA